MRSFVYDQSSYVRLSDVYWGHAGWVTGADTSPDGRLLAVVNAFRGDITLWTLDVRDRRGRACVGRSAAT